MATKPPDTTSRVKRKLMNASCICCHIPTDTSTIISVISFHFDGSSATFISRTTSFIDLTYIDIY